MARPFILALCVAAAFSGVAVAQAPERGSSAAEARAPADDADLAYWLRNMLVDHRYSVDEAAAAVGLPVGEIVAAAKRLGIDEAAAPKRSVGAALRVLPYPGGRHPRIGFLDGAVNPQRETKISVFTPWDEASYVVVDVPEAIWSNLGLTYLAHTHVPTVWTEQGIELERLEWRRAADGSLAIERRLPNGIAFSARAEPTPDDVRMELSLTNGTAETLTGMRVQNCVMLARAAGFEAQTADNKVLSPPYAACRSADGRRWIITGWMPIHRAWANPRCPCVHSDPIFPDCAPGETVRVWGRLWFYEGDDIEAEFRRLDATRWSEARI